MNRSEIMSAVKSKNTRPELLVRRTAFSLGYRYRLHDSKLPGHPDIVFPSRKKVILVHGCFWHGHSCSRGARVPKRNQGYWVRKVAGNRIRDQRNLEALSSKGWNCLVVWECFTRNRHDLTVQIKEFLDVQRPGAPFTITMRNQRNASDALRIETGAQSQFLSSARGSESRSKLLKTKVSS